MRRRNMDFNKFKKALDIKSLVDNLFIIGGGVVIIVFGYPLWGVFCVVVSTVDIFMKKPAFIIPVLRLVIVITGGLTLISSGQMTGGIVCICVCLGNIIEDGVLTTWVGKKAIAS
jgi:hypothetical protein